MTKPLFGLGFRTPLKDKLLDRPKGSLRDETERRKIGSRSEPISPYEPIPSEGRTDRRHLIDVAKDVQRLRKCRSLHLPSDMLGEPAWEIMLTLYIEEEQMTLSITRVTMENDIPTTTALRWISYLEAQMLVSSRADLWDGRRRLLSLTERGRAAMDECMAEMLHS